jgi:hypothetical protein
VGYFSLALKARRLCGRQRRQRVLFERHSLGKARKPEGLIHPYAHTRRFRCYRLFAEVGPFLAIGMKRPGGRATAEKQQQFIDRINQAGGLALMARSVEDTQTQISARAGAGQSGEV